MTKLNSTKQTDDFFAPLENTKPYFKAAFQGFAGSGKTYTAALVALGLHRMIGSKQSYRYIRYRARIKVPKNTVCGSQNRCIGS